MPTDPLAPLLAAVFDPAAASKPGRLRPVVTGWHYPRQRLPRRRRAGLVSPRRAGVTAGTGWRQ